MSRLAKPRRFTILGVGVDALTMEAACARIIARSGSKGACSVVKPYVEFIDTARRQPRIRALLNQAELSLPEGVSLQWAAAYLYKGKPGIWRALGLAASIVFKSRAIKDPLPEKFGGTVFTWRLLEACAGAAKTVYLVGSPAAGPIARTAQTISAKLPGLKIAGYWPGCLAGKTGPDLIKALANGHVEAELVDDLKSKKPDIVLVGMGFPLQELLMAKIQPQLDHGVLIGEGGTFDYDVFGGNLAKAPSWLQSAGLEWLWRLLLQPSRIRRQLAVPRFMWAVYKDSVGRKH